MGMELVTESFPPDLHLGMGLNCCRIHCEMHEIIEQCTDLK